MGDIVIEHQLKNVFRYAIGFVFLLGIMIYMYLLISDHLENTDVHSLEEKIWMYLFLCILIGGFVLSYYSIECGVKESMVSQLSRFGGIKMNISPKPPGNHSIIRSSQFAV